MAWTWVKLQIKVVKKKNPAIGTVHQFSWFNPCKALLLPSCALGKAPQALDPRPSHLGKDSRFKSFPLSPPKGPAHSTAPVSVRFCAANPPSTLFAMVENSVLSLSCLGASCKT